MTVLILGGTTEANALARALAGSDVILSLAGRTATVPDLPCRVRVGGFGGAEGLATFLQAERVSAVIDATHPFAARISAHAAEACAATGIRRLMLVRPMWPERPGDRWVRAASMAEAATRLPDLGKRAFITVGIQELAAFAAAPVWMLVRTLGPAPLFANVVTARGPFSEEDEVALLRAHRIDVLVTKASGGEATYAKIAAARTSGIPVLMIDRPPLPAGEAVPSVGGALKWIHHRGTEGTED